MSAHELNRTQVEDFLFQEADCLDRWALDEWIALWSEEGSISYEVAPTGEQDVGELSHKEAMFLIADDRFRLEQRIVRMKKSTFHAEYHRSHTRHLYGNVRLVDDEQSSQDVTARFNSAVYRSKKGKTVVYPCNVLMEMAWKKSVLRIVRKRIELELDYLDTMGALTILL